MEEKTFYLPKGFRYAGVHCGIRPNTTKLDFALVVSDVSGVAAGVTGSLVAAGLSVSCVFPLNGFFVGLGASVGAAVGLGLGFLVAIGVGVRAT